MGRGRGGLQTRALRREREDGKRPRPARDAVRGDGLGTDTAITGLRSPPACSPASVTGGPLLGLEGTDKEVHEDELSPDEPGV